MYILEPRFVVGVHLEIFVVQDSELVGFERAREDELDRFEAIPFRPLLDLLIDRRLGLFQSLHAQLFVSRVFEVEELEYRREEAEIGKERELCRIGASLVVHFLAQEVESALDARVSFGLLLQLAAVFDDFDNFRLKLVPS